MKKFTLKQFLSLAAAAALALSLAACSANNGGTSPPVTPDSSGSPAPAAEDTITIGILQYSRHPSLDNCYEGIIEGLAASGYVDGENGVVIDYKISQGDNSTGDMMAKTMVASNYDMIIAIATPSAMSAYSAARDSDIPVIFSAVSDPVSAGLAASLDAPQSGASGVSDALNLDGQLAMIRALLPEADTIGILYTTSEPNSISHLEAFKALAVNYNFTIEAVGITNDSEVATGAAALVAKGVDCVNNFTDNNVVTNLSVLLHATNEAGIPVFGSEEEQVRNGCIASESLDYIALGNETGRMAASVLSGEADIMTLPVSVISDSTPVYSLSTLTQFALTLPDAYAHATNLDESE